MRETVCTVVHQRTASLDSERGIDDGSQVHEGRRQTVRRELNSQSTGRPRLKLPAFQPDRRKSAVRNDRGDDGNGGIIRSPIRAIVLPDRPPGVKQVNCLHGGASAHCVPGLRTGIRRYRQRGARRTDADRVMRRTRSRRAGPVC